ncbi:MAG: hypothetical protein LBC77_08110, partial [Spirochaetaceae bacterium]|nr:hypothetical protein [Spirochaetaceae bacterium]
DKNISITTGEINIDGDRAINLQAGGGNTASWTANAPVKLTNGSTTTTGASIIAKGGVTFNSTIDVDTVVARNLILDAGEGDVKFQQAAGAAIGLGGLVATGGNITNEAAINAASMTAIVNKNGGLYTAKGAVTLSASDFLQTHGAGIGNTATQFVGAVSITAAGDITFSSAMNAAAGANVKLKTSASVPKKISIGGSVIAGGADIEFDTVYSPNNIGSVTLTSAANRSITANNLTFKAWLADSSTSACTTITNSGVLSLQDVDLHHLEQDGTGAVRIDSISPGSGAPTRITTRSTSSMYVASDTTLYNDTEFFVDGTLQFNGNIYSEAGKFWNLEAQKKGNNDLDLFEVGSSMGDGNSDPAQSKRLGGITVKANQMKFGGSVYANDEISLQKDNNATLLDINSDFTVDARQIGNHGGGGSPVTPPVPKDIKIQSNAEQIGSLTINGGNFDIGANNYRLAFSSGTLANGFTAEAKILTLAKDTSFIVGDSTPSRDFTIQSGAVLAADTLSKIVMQGTGTITIASPASNRIGCFEIATQNGYVTQGSNLYVKGDWTQPQDNPTGSPFRFNPDNHTVTFTGDPARNTITIAGNTRWYNFIAESPDISEIKFSNWIGTGDAHTFLNNVVIRGTSPTNRVKLTRKTDNPNPPYDENNPPSTPDTIYNSNEVGLGMWVIETAGAQYTFENIEVNYSFAFQNRINVDPTKVDVSVKAPRYSIFWNKEFYYIYSFTEDTDGDGRIDRIRIQATDNIQSSPAGFAGFAIEVEGYEVQGYDTNLGGQSFTPGGADFIYALLTPKAEADTGAALKWTLKSPGALNINGVGIGMPDEFIAGMQTIDTAPPRVLYSLTHPDTDALYIQFSEPMDGAQNVPNIVDTDTNYTWSYSRSLESAFLFSLSGGAPVPKTNLIDMRYYETTLAAVISAKKAAPWQTPALEQPINPLFPKTLAAFGHTPAPNYFQEAANYGALVLPDFELYGADGSMLVQVSTHLDWSSGRRLTDLFILSQPSAQKPVVSFWPNYVVNNTFAGGSPSAMVSQWDGSKALLLSREWDTRNITIDVSIPVISALQPPAPGLLYAFNVPRGYRSASSGKIWLPSINSTGGISQFLDVARNFVPDVYASAKPTPGPSSGTVGADTVYTFSITDDLPKDNTLTDFIFSVPVTSPSPPLFAVRLDIAKESGEWWTGLMPFSFVIQDIIRQRGAVTVLKNVINPDKGESTRVNYVLAKVGQVTIHVFTMDGAIVKTLFRGKREAGEYYAQWDGKNNGGNSVARGMYLIRVVGPDIDEMRKVIVVK